MRSASAKSFLMHRQWSSTFGMTNDNRELGFYAGYLFAAYMAGNFLSAYPLGRLADERGRKKILLLGLWSSTPAAASFLVSLPPSTLPLQCDSCKDSQRHHRHGQSDGARSRATARARPRHVASSRYVGVGQHHRPIYRRTTRRLVATSVPILVAQRRRVHPLAHRNRRCASVPARGISQACRPLRGYHVHR